MRLFAAIDLDASARAAAARTVDTLARRMEDGDGPSAVRWVAANQLHFTLRFLGTVPDDRTERIREAFRLPWATGAFTAGLSGVDLFPRTGAPRVVWLGVDEGRDRMYALKAELDRRLALVGFEPETRPFRAHLTLGRCRRGHAERCAALRDLLSGEQCDPATWMVDRIVLFESQLSSRGSTSHVLESMALPTRAGTSTSESTT